MKKSKAIFENSKQFMEGKKKNLFLLLLVPVVVAILSELMTFLFDLSMKANVFLGVVMALVVFCVWVVRFITDIATPFALINYIDTAHHDKILSPIDSYKIGRKRIFQGFLLLLVKGLIVFMGLIAFILPGVYLGLSLTLSNYAYMVKKKDIRSSLIYSFHIMQDNIGQLILKHLYMAWRIVLSAIPALISLAVLVISTMSLTEQILFAPLALLGLVGFLFFIMKSIKVILVSQEYMYEVFKVIEKSKGEIKEEDLVDSEEKLRKYVKISAILAVVAIVAVSIIFSVLLK